MKSRLLANQRLNSLCNGTEWLVESRDGLVVTQLGAGSRPFVLVMVEPAEHGKRAIEPLCKPRPGFEPGLSSLPRQ